MMNPNAPELSPEFRKDAAQSIWRAERDFATSILVFLWLTKLYFILVVYSFALHLRRGSYTSLPLSKPPSTISTLNRYRSSNQLQSNYNYSNLKDSDLGNLNDSTRFHSINQTDLDLSHLPTNSSSLDN